ncbi:MAG: ABC transporter permease subunit [Myxococcota bacterium]
MTRIYAITVNTFREAVRDRVLLGVVAVASAVLLFTLALGELSLEQEARVIEDIGLASISLFSVAVAVFLGSSLLYKEIDRKTLYVILPKPVRRWEFLTGKLFGIAATGSVFVATMGAVQLLVMGVQPAWETGEGLLPFALTATLALAALALGLRLSRDKTTFLAPWSLAALIAAAMVTAASGVRVAPALWALALNVGEVFVLAAVALFFSSFSTPFLTGLLTLGLWLVGRGAGSMGTMESPLLPESVRMLLHGLARVVPNFQLFVPGRLALVASPTNDPASYVFGSLAYAVAYAAVTMGAASLLFRRRDFP